MEPIEIIGVIIVISLIIFGLIKTFPKPKQQKVTHRPDLIQDNKVTIELFNNKNIQ